MAGETPKANITQKQRDDRRKRLSGNIPQTADAKYYKGDQKSTIQHSPGDTKGRPGDKPKAIPTPNIKIGGDTPQSADAKYYANPKNSKQAPTKQQLEDQARKGIKAAPLRQPAGTPRLANAPAPAPATAPNNAGILTIRIRTVEEIHPLMDSVAEKLLEGTEAVIVEVPKGDVARRARTKLETLVTREVITEDQARDVRFSAYDPSAAPAAPTPVKAPEPPPEPASTKVADDDDSDSFLDPDAILNGGLPPEDEPDTSPVEGVKVVLDDKGAIEQPAAASAAAPSEDEGDSFLAPAAESPVAEDPLAAPETIRADSVLDNLVPVPALSDDKSDVSTLSEDVAASLSEPAEEAPSVEEPVKPRKPARRSGRGS